MLIRKNGEFFFFYNNNRSCFKCGTTIFCTKFKILLSGFTCELMTDCTIHLNITNFSSKTHAMLYLHDTYPHLLRANSRWNC